MIVRLVLPIGFDRVSWKRRLLLPWVLLVLVYKPISIGLVGNVLPLRGASLPTPGGLQTDFDRVSWKRLIKTTFLNVISKESLRTDFDRVSWKQVGCKDFGLLDRMFTNRFRSG